MYVEVIYSIEQEGRGAVIYNYMFGVLCIMFGGCVSA